MNPIFFALLAVVAINAVVANNATSLRTPSPAPAVVDVPAPSPSAEPVVVEESPRTYVEDWMNAHPQVQAKLVRVKEFFQAIWKKIADAGPAAHAFFVKIWEMIVKLIDNLKNMKFREQFEKTIAHINNGYHHVGKAFGRVKELPAYVVDLAKRAFASVKEGYAPVHAHVTRGAKHVGNHFNNFRQSMANLWKNNFRGSVSKEKTE